MIWAFDDLNIFNLKLKIHIVGNTQLKVRTFYWIQ